LAAIDASKIPGTETVNIPRTALTGLAGDGIGLEVKLPQGSLTLDAGALAAVVEKSGGGNISFVVNDAKTSLNARQQAAVGDRPVYDVSIKSGGGYITDFGGGVATISLPYTLKPGESPGGVVVYYLKDDGNIEKISCMYDVKTKCVIFSTTHLSKYYVGYEEWINVYGDVRDTDWFFDAVKYVSENGLFAGTGRGFEPDIPMTRAMMATVLYNYAKPDQGADTTGFSDVKPGVWYSAPVAWAASAGIVKGSGGEFRPDDIITRQETAVILLRFAVLTGKAPSGNDVAGLTYGDSDQISDWAYEAVAWLTVNGVVSGRPGNTFDPQGGATRAEAAAMLSGFIQTIEK
jgi:hypothetical protein